MKVKTNQLDAGAPLSLRHLAIIMDGNGRWAEARGLPRKEGHLAGAYKLRELCSWCIELSVPILSVYAFSTENWKRPIQEVNSIMGLISYFHKQFYPEIVEEGVRVRFAGDPGRLPKQVRKICEKMLAFDPENCKLELIICLNYGGRDEITRGVNRLLKDAQKTGKKLDQITEEELTAALDLPQYPDPDIIFRPGGESRLSNFWLWQSAYAELYFSDTLWPDLSREEFVALINHFEGVERRFGGLIRGDEDGEN